MINKTDKLKKQCLKNASVKSLFDKVAAGSPVKLVSKSQRYWSSDTKDGKCRIVMGATAGAEEKFYHELLHAQLKNEGYKQHLIAWHRNSNELLQRLRALLQPLDNELQHHKMFPRFINAGFARNKFYDDHLLENSIEIEVNKAGADTTADVALLTYLSFCSPGYHSQAMQNLKLQFLKKLDPNLAMKLNNVEQIINQWSNNNVVLTQSGNFKKMILEELEIFKGCRILESRESTPIEIEK